MKKWKAIKEFKKVIDDYYEVSYDGNVRRIYDKKILHKKIALKKRHPYYAVSLKLKDGTTGWVMVHQLVATFFVKIPEKYFGLDVELVPDHIDNNGFNNNYKNLEWKTRGENIKIAHEKGQINNKGENHKKSLISNDEAMIICKYLEENRSYDEIISLMKFPDNKSYRTLLVRIKNGIAWKDISKNFNIDKSSTKYRPSQMETISHLPIIKKLIEEGKRNSEIIRIVWGEDCDKYNSKDITIRNIRKGRIFKDIH